MSLIIILLFSFLCFLPFRIMWYVSMALLNKLLNKLFSKKDIPSKFNLTGSITLLLMYFTFFISIVFAYYHNIKLNTLDWYEIYVSIGFISTLWCYIEWRVEISTTPHFKVKMLPKFSRDKQIVSVKRMVLFISVAAFSLYFGYSQILNIFGDHQIDFSITIPNLTIIPSIIAFDRTLNQLQNLDFSFNKILSYFFK